jgi:hypothetical protein
MHEQCQIFIAVCLVAKDRQNASAMIKIHVLKY